MDISRFFIDRPVLANVLALVIILIGAVAVFQLPVAQYPNVVPPTVQVTSAEFVTSAADARGVPHDAPQVALVGRSNVGKSTLINALLKRRVARTSAAAGKTRLLNFYRVTLDRFAPVTRLYLVDLPGYGYARGGREAQEGFATLLEGYFGGATRPACDWRATRSTARSPGSSPAR